MIKKTRLLYSEPAPPPLLQHSLVGAPPMQHMRSNMCPKLLETQNVKRGWEENTVRVALVFIILKSHHYTLSMCEPQNNWDMKSKAQDEFELKRRQEQLQEILLLLSAAREEQGWWMCQTPGRMVGCGWVRPHCCQGSVGQNKSHFRS